MNQYPFEDYSESQHMNYTLPQRYIEYEDNISLLIRSTYYM